MPALMDDAVWWRIAALPLVESVRALLVAGSLFPSHQRAAV